MMKKFTGRFIAVFTAVILMLSVFASFSEITGENEVYGATETAISAKATVTDGPLNVRSGPGTNYSRLGQLAKGKTVAVQLGTSGGRHFAGSVSQKSDYSAFVSGFYSGALLQEKMNVKDGCLRKSQKSMTCNTIKNPQEGGYYGHKKECPVPDRLGAGADR